MQLYRISPEQYLDNFQGLGASYKDGARWNRIGQPVLYFALSPATALLEMANYIPSPRLVPKDYRLGIYELPDDISSFIYPNNELPSDWSLFPYPASTQTIGGDWLNLNKELVLFVPSCAVPAGIEKIAVVNPSHPECKEIKLIEVTSDLFNSRSFTGID